MKKARYRKAQKKRWIRVTGVWGHCVSCQSDVDLPLHPETQMCGGCTFGEASELMAFDGTWEEER